MTLFNICSQCSEIVLTISLNIKSPFGDWFRSLRHLSFSETHFFNQKSHHQRRKNRFRLKIQGFAQRKTVELIDGPTNKQAYGWTDPDIEMRGHI